MRKYIIAGNWKMNNDLGASKLLITNLLNGLVDKKSTEKRIIVSPSFVNLYPVNEWVKDSVIEVAAQNMHFEQSGAFTGEVSASMLKSIGIKTVIIGHSERRTFFNETDELLAKKVETAIQNELEVIFCFGEQLADRKSENHFNVVEAQLSKALFQLKNSAWNQIVLAYEPVWAIGTGETASPEQAQEMHLFIRNLIAKNYSQELANTISILYGGSMKASNAKELLSNLDVDGGLIGGAALNSEEFLTIYNSI
ncbi:MAG: triose-phosphate isomerase [Flavobacteriaceae bacterium]|nr:triose-phosphate isomerase [Flavobacteriaceae bacterium]